MCGIVGVMSEAGGAAVTEAQLRQMLAMIRHRGPDQFGIYLDGKLGMGSARLSIIDLSTGQQPICNEDGTLWIVFNGEIFNFRELRAELEARGHRFATRTDTEVVLHLYEEAGPKCLERFNGQFAIAIWDVRDRTLFLARDRLGIRPLFYTSVEGALVFGSEIKALLADPRVRAEIDPVSLDQVFVFWSTLSPRTIFRGILEVPPGHYLLAQQGKITVTPYWRLCFPPQSETRAWSSERSLEQDLEEFRALLIDATRIRLRADVPVGAYLSGGLDSSTIAALIRRYTNNQLDTFSIAFSDPGFDEGEFQREMAGYLGTRHQVVHARYEDIGRVFPDVVWHVETPVMRTAPAPMFLLSELVRNSGYKVVLTGEGADEFLAGYDIFKEAAVRRFWARRPESAMRPRLLQRLYPDIFNASNSNWSCLAAFFGQELTEVNCPYYSHAVRWRNNSRTRRFLSPDIAAAAQERFPNPLDAVPYPAEFSRWGALQRSQYLESTIFLSEYLLSSQGDRVAMAHSVEGRFPFLDYRVVEFCNRLPDDRKLNGLTEKFLLKKLGAELLPGRIAGRRKRPYRAPIHRSFFHGSQPDYVREMLGPECLKSAGLFKPAAVNQLIAKIERGLPIGETDDMALAGILSSQLLYSQFIAGFRLARPLSLADDVKVCGRAELSTGV